MAINFLNTVAVDDNVLFVDTTNDRVGINTASPSRTLQLGDGSTDESIGVYYSDGAYMRLHGYGMYMSRTSSYIRPVTTNTQTLFVGHDTNVWNAISNNAITHYFRKGTDEQMRITSTGNVGIGTTSPGSKLHIASAMGTAGRFDGTVLRLDTTNTVDTTGFQGIRFATSTAPNYGWSMGANRSTNGRGSFRFYEHNNSVTGTERFTILQDGNVGIGTDSPDVRLEVVELSPTNGIIADFVNSANGAGTTAAIKLSNTDSEACDVVLGANRVGADFGSDFFISLSDSVDGSNQERFRITEAGNVGIGTTSPDYKLDVEGDISLVGGGENYAIMSPINQGMQIAVGDPADTAVPLVTFNGDQKVGIGTTSPSEKLDVEGNVKIKDALLSNQENTDIDSAAAEVVAQVAHATYTAAFFDFVVKKGTNVRSGTVYACHNGDTTPLVEFTETSTNDLGDTSDVTLSVDISGTNMRLLATVTSDDWSVKSLIRAI